ncbi:MAG TPA: hypothetical protein VLL73_05715, partial [Desulfurivibrionaceae bacterium]|nr:hypothetical protein [Desulfurivibrionaceae bacterium]
MRNGLQSHQMRHQQEGSMRSFSSRMRLVVAILFAGTLAASPALAQKPDWAGGDKKGAGQKAKATHGQKEDKGNQKRGHDDNGEADHGKSHDRGEKREHSYFTVQHRDSLHEYFSGQFRKSKGDCPPGLAKKRNGCLPPGQAKK